jgi:hypothetical protein
VDPAGDEAGQAVPFDFTMYNPAAVDGGDPAFGAWRRPGPAGGREPLAAGAVGADGEEVCLIVRPAGEDEPSSGKKAGAESLEVSSLV